MPRAASTLICLATVLASVGCFSTPEHLIEENPARRIAAAKDAALHKDFSRVDDLVHDLTDPDPAVRFYASRSLGEIAGESFGYLYYLDPLDQGPSIDRWNQWLQSLGPATRPATRPSARAGN